MPPAIQFRVKSDSLSPALRKAVAQVGNRKPILEAMGLQLLSITKRAFGDASLRAAPWPGRRSGGSHPLLRKSGTLWRSIRVVSTTNTSVTVGTDRPYAAIHQLGGKAGKGGKAKIPARPFFPFINGKLTITAATKLEATARRKLQSLLPK